eukprot:403358578
MPNNQHLNSKTKSNQQQRVSSDTAALKSAKTIASNAIAGGVSINTYQDDDIFDQDDDKFFSVRGSSYSKNIQDNIIVDVNSQQHDVETQAQVNGVSLINKTEVDNLYQTEEESTVVDEVQMRILNSGIQQKKQMKSLLKPIQNSSNKAQVSNNGESNSNNQAGQKTSNVQQHSQQAVKITQKSQNANYDPNNDSAQKSSESSNNTKDDENNTSQQAQIPKRNKNRKDIYGNRIRRGGKKHKVVFADHKALGKPLYEIHSVESFKKYNTDMSARGENKSCCNVF